MRGSSFGVTRRCAPALEWSYGLLSADEQAVFSRLGVFAGGFALELAQKVVSDDPIDQWLVLDLLGRLIDKSLVIAQGEAEPRAIACSRPRVRSRLEPWLAR